MPSKKIAILGDGHMATEAMKIVARYPGLRLTSVAFHDDEGPWTSRLRSEARAQHCEELPSQNFGQAETVDRLRVHAPDLILSVNNSDIIRADLLTLPTDGIINFHNGPLPQYRGVNIPSWAIINGATTHGISWHFVDEGLDTGPVVLAAPVVIDEDETAISLIAKCIAKGLETLPELLNLYANSKLIPVPQQGPGHYYSLQDSPDGGHIDLSWSRSRIASLVRGLTFHPSPNTFVYPKVAWGDTWISVGHVEEVGKRFSSPIKNSERVVNISDNALLVSAADGLMKFSFLMDENGNEVTVDEIYQQSPPKTELRSTSARSYASRFDRATRSILPLRFKGKSGSTHTCFGDI